MAENTIDQRLDRIEAALLTLATKSDLADAIDDVKADIAETKAEIAVAKADIAETLVGFATKADLFSAVTNGDRGQTALAGAAKNVDIDITALQRLIERSLREIADLRQLNTIQQQLLQLHLQPLSRVPEMLTDVVGLLHRLVDRVAALEAPAEG